MRVEIIVTRYVPKHKKSIEDVVTSGEESVLFELVVRIELFAQGL